MGETEERGDRGGEKEGERQRKEVTEEGGDREGYKEGARQRREVTEEEIKRGQDRGGR